MVTEVQLGFSDNPTSKPHNMTGTLLQKDVSAIKCKMLYRNCALQDTLQS